jgi:putative heme transporter
VSTVAAPAPRARGRRIAVRFLQVVASFAVVGLLFVYVLPRVTGADGKQVLHTLSHLSWEQLTLLVVVWLASLWAYTYVLCGSLPGLTHLQALTLNLSGSAVSNLVPFGGAVGIGVTFAMATSWGFRPSRVALSTVVTGLWNVLAKLALPLIALLGLLVTGDIADERLVVASAIASVLLALVVAVMVAALSSESFARWCAVVVEWVGTRVLRLVRSHRTVRWDRAVMDLRHSTIGLMRTGALTMSLGMVAYALLQATLAWLCLRAVGSDLSVAEVFAGYAFGRLLTSVVATPSGVGIAETGSAALLVAFGGDPVTSTAGVLLFSVFTYLIEIPVGGIGWLTWALYTPWRRSVPAPAVEDDGPLAQGSDVLHAADSDTAGGDPADATVASADARPSTPS